MNWKDIQNLLGGVSQGVTKYGQQTAQQVVNDVKNLPQSAGQFVMGKPGTGNGDVNDPTGGGESPIGAIVRGNWSDVLPALGRRDQYFAKNPGNIQFGGEMETTGGGVALPPIKSIKQNSLTRAGNAIKSDVGKVQAPDANTSLYGPEHTTNIQNALVRNKVDNYGQLPQAARKLYDNVINPELSKNPKLVSIEDVTSKIVEEMRKLSPGLDSTESKNAAHGVINDMYDIARNAQGPEAVVPSHIDTPNLFNISQKLNSTTAVDKFFRGQPPANAVELATVAARNAIKNIIADTHPVISQATKDYGLLKDAVPSLFKASQEGRGIGLNLPLGPHGVTIGLPGIVAGPVRDITGGTLRTAGKVADTPVGKAIGVAGLVGAGAGLGMSGLPSIIHDKLVGQAPNANAQQNGNSGQGSNNSGSPVVQGNSLVPQNPSQIKPDQNGDYQLPQNAPYDANYMTQSQRQQMEQGLTPGTPEYTKIEQQYQASQDLAKQNLSGDKLTAVSNIVHQNYVGAGNGLRQEMQQITPGVWNKIGQLKSFQEYASNPNNPFAQEVYDIDDFNNKFASTYQQMTGANPSKSMVITPGDSPDQAMQKWHRMQQFLVNSYQQYASPYLALTSSTGTQTRQGQPPAAQYLPPMTSDSQGDMTQRTKLAPLTLGGQ